MSGRTATLYINKSESRCGACNRGCDPSEESHITLLGWAAVDDRMEGCGALYIAVDSDYIGLPGLAAGIRAMRPDLPYIGGDS